MGYSSYIPAQKIEDEAMSVLAAYAQKYKEPITAPVPIEEILDCLYDVTIEAAALRAKYQNDDVLAEFLVGRNRKVILIDQTIHPDFNADKEGRYRFTLGHETGHWILHQHLLASVNTDNLFDDYKDGGLEYKRANFGWQIGTTLDINRFNVGIMYGIDFNEIAEDCRQSNFQVRLGYNF